MTIEVRTLAVDDIFTVARMLSKVTKAARAELATALVEQEEGKQDPTELGMVLFQTLFIESETDLKDWLASLVEQTPEDFGKLPATALVDIVECLAAQEGVSDFFGRVSQLVAKAVPLVSTASSTKSSPDTDG